MTPNELRIGNYVRDGISNDIHISALYLYEYSSRPDLYSDLEPIPLTEKWLIDFGFSEVFDKNRWFEDDKVYESKSKILQLNLLSSPLSKIIQYDAYIKINYHPPSACSYNTRTIKHVHQLQNLYFALTGEELIIQP